MTANNGSDIINETAIKAAIQAYLPVFMRTGIAGVNQSADVAIVLNNFPGKFL
jgi:hypothetical protein